MKELLKQHSQSHAPQMPQPQVPQSQSPQLQMPQPQSPQIQIPQPLLAQPPTTSYPSNQVAGSKEDSRAARRARRSNQQVINTSGPGFPSDSTFQNIQHHISPGGNINYSYIAGNVTHSVKDDSFNVGGNNNNITMSFTR
jgi:hypothetical protein